MKSPIVEQSRDCSGSYDLANLESRVAALEDAQCDDCTFDKLTIDPCDVLDIIKPKKIADGENIDLAEFENITTIFGPRSEFDEANVKALPMHVLESEPLHYSNANTYDEQIDIAKKLSAPIINATDATCGTHIIEFADISSLNNVDKSNQTFQSIPNLNSVFSGEPIHVEEENIHRVNTSVKMAGLPMYAPNETFPSNTADHSYLKMVKQNGVITLKYHVINGSGLSGATSSEIADGPGLYFTDANFNGISYLVYISTCSGITGINFKVNKAQQEQVANQLYMYKEYNVTDSFLLFRALNTVASTAGSTNVSIPADSDFTRAEQVIPTDGEKHYYLANISSSTRLMYEQATDGTLGLYDTSATVFSCAGGYGFVNNPTGAFTYSPIDKFIYDEEEQTLFHNSSASTGNAVVAAPGFYHVEKIVTTVSTTTPSNQYVNIGANGKVDYSDFAQDGETGTILFANTEVYTFSDIPALGSDKTFSDLVITLADAGVPGEEVNRYYINYAGVLCYAEDGIANNNVSAGDPVTNLAPGVYRCLVAGSGSTGIFIEVQPLLNGTQLASKLTSGTVAYQACDTEIWHFEKIGTNSQGTDLSDGVHVDPNGRVIGVSSGEWDSSDINDDYIVITSGDSYILRKIILISDDSAEAVLDTNADDAIAGPGVVGLSIAGGSKKLYRIAEFAQPLEKIACEWVIDDDENTLMFVDEDGIDNGMDFEGHIAWPVEGDLRLFLSKPHAEENSDRLIWAYDENYDGVLKQVYGDSVESAGISAIERYLFVDMIENESGTGFKLGKFYMHKQSSSDEYVISGLLEEIPSNKYRLNFSQNDQATSLFLLLTQTAGPVDGVLDPFNNFPGVFADCSDGSAESVYRSGFDFILYENNEALANRVVVDESDPTPENRIVYITDEEGYAQEWDFTNPLYVVRENNCIEMWTDFEDNEPILGTISTSLNYVGYDNNLYESNTSLEDGPVCARRALMGNYLELDVTKTGSVLNRPGLVLPTSMLFIHGARAYPDVTTMVVVLSEDHPNANGQYIWNGETWDRYTPVSDLGAELVRAETPAAARHVILATRLHVGSTAPTAADVAEGDLWLDTSAAPAYVNVTGGGNEAVVFARLKQRQSSSWVVLAL